MSLIVVPTEPRSLTAVDSTDSTMTLSWMEPDMPNGIIIRYQVEYRVTSTDQSSILLQNATSLPTILTGLLPYTEYSFRVAAVTREGIGPYTNFTANFTTGKFLRNLIAFIYKKVETYRVAESLAERKFSIFGKLPMIYQSKLINNFLNNLLTQ